MKYRVKRLLVVGASGEMGRRIVTLADRLLDDVQVVAGTHRREVSNDLETRRIDILGSAASIAQSLNGIDAVINAVGPYNYDPTNLLLACLESGCHYVDLAETPEFISRLNEFAKGEFVSHQSPYVLTGCSTIPALVQVLAQSWRKNQEIASTRVFLSIGSANPASPGLLYSVLRPMGRESLDGRRYFSKLVRKRFQDGDTRLHGRYPSTIDTDGLLVGDRRFPAKLWFGFDKTLLNIGLHLMARPLSICSDGLLLKLCGFSLPLVALLSRLGTPRGFLSIEGLDSQGRLVAEIQVRARTEGLNIPALPSIWAVQKLLGEGGEPPGGVVTLDRLVTSSEAMEWLAHEGYDVVYYGGDEKSV